MPAVYVSVVDFFAIVKICPSADIKLCFWHIKACINIFWQKNLFLFQKQRK
jgi:hypothetical protein